MTAMYSWPPWVWVVSACGLIALVGAVWRLSKWFRWFLTGGADMR